MTDGREEAGIYLAENTIEHQELAALADWLLSGKRLTKGELCDAFEKEFAEVLGAKHAVFVNSGSSANLLALYALIVSGRIGEGGIVVPAVSWVTTVTPAIQFKVPVHLCDCNRRDLGLDLDHLERIFQEKNPSAVFVVHVLGHPNDMEALLELCDRYGVLLIEDGCEGLGSTYQQSKLGTFGIMGTFSFYYGHQISTIEGGMLVTDDAEINSIARSLRAHGWSRDVDPDVAQKWEEEYEIDTVRRLYSFYYPGFNCRSTDLNAFLGRSQLKKLSKVVEYRQRNYERYCLGLRDKYWVQKSDYDSLASLAFGTLVRNRSETYKYLKDHGIETRPLICGSIGRQPFWIKQYGVGSLPNADIIHEYGIYLPNHDHMTEEDVHRVVSVFREVAEPFTEF